MSNVSYEMLYFKCSRSLILSRTQPTRSTVPQTERHTSTHIHTHPHTSTHIHTHRAGSGPSQLIRTSKCLWKGTWMDVTKRTQFEFRARTFTNWLAEQKCRILHLFNLNVSLILVTVTKWHRLLCWRPYKTYYHVQNKKYIFWFHCPFKAKKESETKWCYGSTWVRSFPPV